jgi:hypothetical protein
MRAQALLWRGNMRGWLRSLGKPKVTIAISL